MSNPVRTPVPFCMNAVTLELLVLCYYSGSSRPCPLTSPARRDAARFLVHHELLLPGAVGNGYELVYPHGALTDRGRAHMETLLNLPLPVARTVWETPQGDK